MFALFFILSLLSLFAQQGAAHGRLHNIMIRQAGPKSKEVCGAQFNIDRDGVADKNGLMLASNNVDTKRNPYLPTCPWTVCTGFQYEDNVENLYTFPAGTVVPLRYYIGNHHEGWANVSVVNTKTDTIIGSMLKKWDSKFSVNDNQNNCPTVPDIDQNKFEVTIPDLGDQCITPGVCVVQFFWYSKIYDNQMFNSCVDFVQPHNGSPVPPMVTNYQPKTTEFFGCVAPEGRVVLPYFGNASYPGVSSGSTGNPMMMGASSASTSSTGKPMMMMGASSASTSTSATGKPMMMGAPSASTSASAAVMSNVMNNVAMTTAASSVGMHYSSVGTISLSNTTATATSVSGAVTVTQTVATATVTQTIYVEVQPVGTSTAPMGAMMTKRETRSRAHHKQRRSSH